MPKIIGIDLGTTNSAVAVLEGGRPTIIPNSLGDKLTPSLVVITSDGEVVVGREAKNQAVLQGDRTVRSIKRKIGTDYRLSLDGREYSPEELSSLILSRLRQDAETYLDAEVEKAVITVPAHFNDAQRQATINAGRIAGLEVVRIINEPTAAALAHGLEMNREQLVVVFDLGGGTYDVSVLEIGGGVFEVRATAGDNHLGGDDFDDFLLTHVAEQLQREEGIDLCKDRMALGRLREEVERVKMELSETTTSRLNIPFITADKTGPKHLDMSVTRSQFESLIRRRVEDLKGPFQTAMGDVGLSAGDIDQVLLVGGSTRVPLVREMIVEMVGETIIKGINPDEIVALGAAIQGGILAGEKRGVVLVDVTPLTLGIEVEGGLFAPVIPRNTPIPASNTRLFTTVSEDQKVVEINVLQGERRQAGTNRSLGSFSLSGIRPAAKGEPRIEVRFDIDVDGVVNVAARDLDTGADQAITISGTTGLSETEVRELIDQAEKHRESDREYEERAHWYTGVDSLLAAAEARIGEDIDVLASPERQALFDDLAGAAAELRQAREDGDMERMHHLVESIKFIVGELEAG